MRRYSTGQGRDQMAETEQKLEKAEKKLQELKKKRDSALNHFLEAEKERGKDSAVTIEWHDILQGAREQVSVAESRVASLTGQSNFSSFFFLSGEKKRIFFLHGLTPVVYPPFLFY
eukprot:TRINITY_DN3497_c0_g1_i18.p1 TRINITY_DN3497_c0_g1~~TRINITY_DN3497_c0_g1_i18.p1  ORF type:complete len:116 (-),score=20.66 TRINITY_DN3497_c0_g1_i18:65-412(-)